VSYKKVTKNLGAWKLVLDIIKPGLYIFSRNAEATSK